LIMQGADYLNVWRIVELTSPERMVIEHVTDAPVPADDDARRRD